uniref:TSA: Wollemia nobilis Ref_Wollemi_Transcript_937_1609 transcribed RNA sequence n=1 Tax=Wollemia nobilis TaxID=56998 RepID=A0A0C9RQX4_9CONI
MGGNSSFGQQGSGGSCGSPAFSSEGSSGAFGPSGDNRDDEYQSFNYRHHPWTGVYENPPVILHHHHHDERSSRKSKCFSWGLTSIFGGLIGSLWMLFGLYGSQNLEMGLNYSRILSANRLFVQSISVQNRELAPGPRLYLFKNPPELDDEKEWSVDHHIAVPGFYHKEWAMWLNRKSIVKLEYNILSPSSLFLVIAQGKKNYNEWIQDTGNPEWCVLWTPVDGHGDITFEATEDDEYYIGIANLHQMSMQIKLNMDIKAKVYETEDADFWCPLDARSCTIALSLRGSNVGIVTTPDKPQEGLDVWYVTVSYHTRWSTYIVIYGILGLILLSIYSCRLKSNRRTGGYPEVASLNSLAGPISYYGAIPTVASVYPQDELHINSPKAGTTAEEIPDENVCTICFEHQKNSFFQPCGHYATCYSCGLRVKEVTAVCPICRQNIQDVRKIYIT